MFRSKRTTQFPSPSCHVPSPKSCMSRWPEVTNHNSHSQQYDLSWPIIDTMTSLAVNTYRGHLMSIRIDFKWRHRTKGASTRVILLTICDLESPWRAGIYYGALLLLKNIFYTSIGTIKWFLLALTIAGMRVLCDPLFYWPNLDATRTW